MVKDNQIVNVKDIQRIFSIIKKNWWIAVLLVSLGAFSGYIYSYKQQNVFLAKSQILLKNNDQFNQGSVISDAGSYYGNSYRTYMDNSNEKRVITSYDLIKQAIDRLDFKVSYFLVGRLRTEELFAGVPFHVQVNVFKDDLYEKMIQFRVLDDKSYELVYVNKKDVEKKVKGEFGKELVSTEMDVLVNKTQAFGLRKLDQMKAASYLIQVHLTQTLVSRFQANLKVENPDFTNILELSISDDIAARGVMFLDTLAQVYIENSLQSRIDINKNTLFFIERQLGEVTGILNNIEDTLYTYKRDKHIIDLQREGAEYFSQYIGFDNQGKSLELQLEALDDLEHYIIEDKDPQFLPPSLYLISDNDFLAKSVSELYSLQLQLNEVSVSATPSNFALQQMQNRVEMLKKDMLVYIKNSKDAIKGRQQNVGNQMNSSISSIQEIPEKQRGLTGITRQLKVNEDMYLFLLQRRANTVIARAGIVPDTKIIEKARSAGKVSPNKMSLIYVSGGIGLVLSLLIILVRLFFFERIESFEEMKGFTNLPIVGEIVQKPISEELKVAVEHEPKSPLAEAFRTVRTNLQYLSGEPTPGRAKMIVITSFNPGEGKTFCSINLAAILAKTGKKVLLLELDLHKPRVQKGLGLTSEKGVSTYIIGKNEVQDVILPTHIENLSVILSGALPPNPSELILSPRMHELFEYGRRHYDYIVVDTPPVGLLSDGLVLMKSADVCLFVVNIKFAYRNVLRQVHEMVEFHGFKNFGFLLNGVKRKKSRYYYNRYGYGYSYGGYGSYGGGYGSYGSYDSSESKSVKKEKK